MPRDLPGFYWDTQRNRYFSINSKPPATLHKPQPPPPQLHPITTSTRLRKFRSIWEKTQLGKSELLEHQRAPNRHHLLGLHYAETASVKEQRVPVFGAVRNFVSTTTESGQIYRLIGDSQGWIYSLRGSEDDSEHVQRQWVIETNLDIDSEISSLNICNSYSLATSFGPISKMRLQKLDDPSLSFILTAKECHDIRCADFTNSNEIIVGAKQYAVYITDVFNTTRIRVLKTHSDVFSIARQQNLAYAGTRNGNIHRFDLRIPSDRGVQALLSNRPRSTVLHMQLIDDIRFLTGYMDGQLVMYDIRFTRQSAPLLQFTGHVNTHTPHLGIATDPNNEFLFAAGQDRRIRAWSLQNGDPLVPARPTNTISTIMRNAPAANTYANFGGAAVLEVNPLLTVFEDPVQTMQITQGRGGLCMWVGCGDRLFQFGLGRRNQGEQQWQVWGEDTSRIHHQ